MPGQVAKSHSERLSAATKNSKSYCSHSIYQLQQRILANDGHLCHVLPPPENGFWLPGQALQTFFYEVTSNVLLPPCPTKLTTNQSPVVRHSSAV